MAQQSPLCTVDTTQAKDDVLLSQTLLHSKRGKKERKKKENLN
jgi:hypothetical protein